MSRQKSTRQKDNSQVERLLETLKWLFKSRGMRYVDVASALGVSRTTLKRRLAGKGLTVDLLESLSDLAGLGLNELFDIANAGADPRRRRLSPKQEEALLADGPLGFIFGRIREGWSAQELQQECNINEARLVGYLVALEKLGLIDLLPGNRIRLRTARDIDWRKPGLMWHALNRHMKEIFAMTDPEDSESARRIAIVKLSAASIAQIEGLFEGVQAEVRRLAHNDRSIVAENKFWYAILLGGRPFDMNFEESEGLPWKRRGAAAPSTASRARKLGQGGWETDRRTVTKRHLLLARHGSGRA